MNKHKKDIIAWWSGGIASAVTCYLCIELFGKDRVRIIFQDTKNEHKDTYRFLKDCEKWYGIEVDIISSNKFDLIEDVWYKYKSLNTAHGAICSTELKRNVRIEWEKENTWTFEMNENMKVSAGEYAIMPKEQFEKLISALDINSVVK